MAYSNLPEVRLEARIVLGQRLNEVPNDHQFVFHDAGSLLLRFDIGLCGRLNPFEAFFDRLEDELHHRMSLVVYF